MACLRMRQLSIMCIVLVVVTLIHYNIFQDWQDWALKGDDAQVTDNAPAKASSVKSVKSTRSSIEIPKALAVADEKALKFLQNAYDKCSAEVRKARRTGKLLREVRPNETCFRQSTRIKTTAHRTRTMLFS